MSSAWPSGDLGQEAHWLGGYGFDKGEDWGIWAWGQLDFR